jgi:hypothetical protein
MAFVNDELFPNLKEPSELLEKNATPAVLH